MPLAYLRSMQESDAYVTGASSAGELPAKTPGQDGPATQQTSEPKGGIELSNESLALVAEARKLNAFSDDDGICCLPAIRGEPTAHERLLRLLEAAYGDDWTAGTLTKLLAESAAKGLKTKLEAILGGEAPLDIFVRWKPIEAQPIGWEPDFNDGVRPNIRPFLLAGDVGKKGAGILRDKPNIHWKKDRGKDVESAPWFHRFQGDRINDHHLSLAEKRAAKAADAADAAR